MKLFNAFKDIKLEADNILLVDYIDFISCIAHCQKGKVCAVDKCEEKNVMFVLSFIKGRCVCVCVSINFCALINLKAEKNLELFHK